MISKNQKGKRVSRTAQIRALFRQGKSLTPLQSIGVFSLYRLADVVFKLRKKHEPIVTVIRSDPQGHEYAEYRLARRGDMVTYINSFGDTKTRKVIEVNLDDELIAATDLDGNGYSFFAHFGRIIDIQPQVTA